MYLILFSLWTSHCIWSPACQRLLVAQKSRGVTVSHFKKALSTGLGGSFTPQGLSQCRLCFLYQNHSCDCPEVPGPEKGVPLIVFYYIVKNLATQFYKCVYTHVHMYYFKQKKNPFSVNKIWKVDKV